VYSRQWILYSLIRVGVFAAALALLVLVGVNVLIAAVAAAVIGFCVSYIFLRGPRNAVAKSIVELRTKKDRDDDNDLENDVLDRLEGERLDGDGGRKG
jgi:cell division protein FtsL